MSAARRAARIIQLRTGDTPAAEHGRPRGQTLGAVAVLRAAPDERVVGVPSHEEVTGLGEPVAVQHGPVHDELRPMPVPTVR